MNFVIQRWSSLGARRKYWMLLLAFCALATLLIPYTLAAEVLSLIAATLSGLAQGAASIRS